MYIPFANDFLAHGISHNNLELSLFYDKKDGGPVLRMQAVERYDSDSFTGTRMALFGSPSMRVTLETDWKRDNKKKIATMWNAIQQDIERKEGVAWEEIESFAKKHNIQLS